MSYSEKNPIGSRVGSNNASERGRMLQRHKEKSAKKKTAGNKPKKGGKSSARKAWGLDRSGKKEAPSAAIGVSEILPKKEKRRKKETPQ